jgi:hypothetical protein
LTVVIFGQKGLEIGGGNMVWAPFALAPVHEETRLSETKRFALRANVKEPGSSPGTERNE